MGLWVTVKIMLMLVILIILILHTKGKDLPQKISFIKCELTTTSLPDNSVLFVPRKVCVLIYLK